MTKTLSVTVDDDKAAEWMLDEAQVDFSYDPLGLRPRCPECGPKKKEQLKLVIRLYHEYLESLGLVSENGPDEEAR
jgi:hypothetical protein